MGQTQLTFLVCINQCSPQASTLYDGNGGNATMGSDTPTRISSFQHSDVSPLAFEREAVMKSKTFPSNRGNGNQILPIHVPLGACNSPANPRIP